MLHQLSNTTLLQQHDWTRVRTLGSYLFSKVEQGYFDQDVTWEPAYDAKIYNIGSHGSVILNYSLTENTAWYTWTGSLLENVIPWASALKQKLETTDLNFINFTYSKHTSNIAPHIDGKKHNEQGFGSCNINFIIDSASANSFTFAEHQGTRSQYPTVKGATWLLDTDVIHGVVNQGTREIFQIKFYSPFAKVREFFEHNRNFLNVDRV